MSEPDLPPEEPIRMPVWIYKGTRRTETYLYVSAPGGFERVPPELLVAFGELELVLTLELYPERRLARANVMEVMRSLSARGFYVQLPPVDTGGPRRVH